MNQLGGIRKQVIYSHIDAVGPSLHIPYDCRKWNEATENMVMRSEKSHNDGEPASS